MQLNVATASVLAEWPELAHGYEVTPGCLDPKSVQTTGFSVVLRANSKLNPSILVSTTKIAIPGRTSWERVEIGGPLDQAGQFGGFGQRDLAQVLPQIGLRRLSKTADAEGAAPSQ